MLYSDFTENPTKILKMYDAYNSTEERKFVLESYKYYIGENVGINKVRKMVALKDEGNNIYTKENPFLSNFKIADNEFQSIVDQKVDSLFYQDPKFEGMQEQAIKQLTEPLSYALFEMATEASIYGNSYCFIDITSGEPKFLVFENKQCLPFYDDETCKLKALARVWETTNFSNKTTQYVEIYDEKRYTLYKSSDSKNWTTQKQLAYFSNIVGNAYTTREEPVESWSFPIVEMKNNKNKNSDLTKSIRGMIDAIDICVSDWANNLADLQQAFFVVKGLDPGMDAQDLSGFINTLRTTYQALLPEGAEIDAVNMEIPFEAKKEFLAQINSKLIKSASMADSEIIEKGQMTNVALKIAYDRLIKKVSRFEYFVNCAGLEILNKIKEFKKDTTSDLISIEFRKGFVDNDTETIQNLAMSQGVLSKETILSKHPYVDNVEEEKQRIEEEAMSIFENGGLDDNE